MWNGEIFPFRQDIGSVLEKVVLGFGDPNSLIKNVFYTKALP